MKKGNPENQQQLKLFIKELITFAVLFFTLGLIVYYLFQNSVYGNIDSAMREQKNRIIKNSHQFPLHIQKNKNGANIGVMPPEKNASFQTNLIVFDDNGRILNQSMLGERNFTLLRNTTLDVSKLNKIVDLPLASNELSAHFRSLLIKVPKNNQNVLYAGHYVLILQNIDADLLAINSFIESLIITLVIFWILAIAISYFLSKSSMKPIIKSWLRQRDFSSNAAHELRTPLTVIQNQMEYLLTKPKDTVMEQIQPISTSLDEIQHLKILTNRLLMLARSDSNIIQVNLQNTQLETWFKQVISPYSEIVNSQNKYFDTQINVDGSGMLDQDLIRQLLVILLDNAMKYTPAEGKISVQISRIKDSLDIKVADNGIGISDEDKVHIFDRFYRTDKSRNSKTGGNGLGLSIAKWIVDEHKGKISVVDNKPEGTVFNVTISLK
ncbi:histidine kinase [Apilactobacillus ozensis DSM 23829 = JCM 17196]|uniref:histidine kinase n=2 Tax=Apilactobacillus ozensis TaxID=866801 RepID=A0A0R2ASN2_9LACO|nr:HAMP domain-containing sensor histidine kinase [Apilactobacillus ozensis]KRM69685.1 histidine kinase [Apilactobacillus ozensis DSM 23829 = JCM 17196]